ncbi:MAG: glycogen-binding domain-containing protein [Spirochaetales bacterium]|nr:glycogen-binding domain-containing protein [Spirochaetales bacterium]
MKKPVIILLIAILGSAFLFSYEGGSRDIYFKIAGAKMTEAPQIMENKLILLYKPDEPTRFVGAAFAHEDYISIHPFKINENEVFYLVFPLPEDQASLDYRLIVDGLWMADPSNSRIYRDTGGISISNLSLPPSETRDLSSPQIKQDGRVTFIFKGNSGEKVYLSGSFNHWDPFLYRMSELSPGSGIYEITLPIRRGIHYYQFIYRGAAYTDPQNLDLSMDINNREVSVLNLTSG